MKERLEAKLDEHIEKLLNKPELTNEEYAILKDRLSAIRYAEAEEIRKKEWEEKYKPMIEMAFNPPSIGGGFCAN